MHIYVAHPFYLIFLWVGFLPFSPLCCLLFLLPVFSLMFSWSFVSVANHAMKNIHHNKHRQKMNNFMQVWLRTPHRVPTNTSANLEFCGICNVMLEHRNKSSQNLDKTMFQNWNCKYVCHQRYCYDQSCFYISPTYWTRQAYLPKTSKLTNLSIGIQKFHLFHSFSVTAKTHQLALCSGAPKRRKTLWNINQTKTNGQSINSHVANTSTHFSRQGGQSMGSPAHAYIYKCTHTHAYIYI